MADREKTNTICRYLSSVYTDAKILSSSAYSWPARTFANESSRKFDITDPAGNEERKNKTNLQYINPKAHADFLECIAKVDQDIVEQKMETCLAMSFRVDGSIDRTNIDKIYLLAQTIDATGEREMLFIGVGEQTERGARGLFQTIKNIVNRHGAGAWEKSLKKMSSFVTDGASINIGEHNGLWRLIRDEADAVGAVQRILMIWCAAHRSDLCVKDLGKSVSEVKTAIKMCSKISHFIRNSAVRLVEIKKISAERKVNLHLLPKYYEVRWSQYSLQLIDATLASWRCLVHYFQFASDLNDKYSAEATGYLRYLKDFENLKLLCFLGDLFHFHTLFQKQLQSNDLNIMKLQDVVSGFKQNLEDLQETPLLGGWEEEFSNMVRVNEDDCHFIDDIVIHNEAKRVQPTRLFPYLRAEIVSKMVDFTSIRFSTEADEACSTMVPFFKFHKEVESVRSVHKLLATDQNLSELYVQFLYICNHEQLRKKSPPNLLKHLVQSQKDTTQSFSNIMIVLARMIAATPHSADVERSISANNRLKTAMRNRLSLETENNYLFIHFNLPTFYDWKPDKAILHWPAVKQRRTHNLLVENTNRKSKNQQHFNGIFPSSRNMGQENKIEFSDEDENEDSSAEASVVIVHTPRASKRI